MKERNSRCHILVVNHWEGVHREKGRREGKKWKRRQRNEKEREKERERERERKKKKRKRERESN